MKNRKKGCCNDQMDLRYATMWNIHKLTTTKDEGCKDNTTQRIHYFEMEYQTIALMILVQMETPKSQHLTSTRTRNLLNTWTDNHFFQFTLHQHVIVIKPT